MYTCIYTYVTDNIEVLELVGVETYRYLITRIINFNETLEEA